MVENLGLASGGVGDEALVQDIENVLADLLELELDLAAVLLDGGDVLVRALGLLLLLNRRDNAPRGTAGTNDVLIGDREKVTLLDSELLVGKGNGLHLLDHLYKQGRILGCCCSSGYAHEAPSGDSIRDPIMRGGPRYRAED